MYLESVSRTHTGLIREMNQDGILQMGRRGLFLVADGMGGEKAGEEASAKVVHVVDEEARAFFKKPPTEPGQVENLLRRALTRASQEVLAISAREPAKRGLGSTASLLCLHRGMYWFAHVGDSRIYRLRGGSLTQLTRDHTVVWELYQQGSLSHAQLETHPDRHLLTRCVGAPGVLEIDQACGKVQRGDLFLICSDGLTGYVPEGRLAEVLADSRMTLEEQADVLVHGALEAGGGDNVSVILARAVQLADEDNWEPPLVRRADRSELATAETVVDERLLEMAGQAGPPKPRRAAWPWPWIAGLCVVAALLALAFHQARTSASAAAWLVLEWPEQITLDGLTIASQDSPGGSGLPIHYDRAWLASRSQIDLKVASQFYTITAQAAGRKDFETVCQLSAGERKTVRIQFEE